MPTNKPRVTITMTEQELGAIEDYQYFNNKKNQTQAILDLIRKGLDEAEAASTEISAEELAHIKKYRVLDTHGKKVVDSALELEYERMTHVETKEMRGGITYISLFDLAVSAGTGEPLGTTDYTTKIQIPTEQVPEEAHVCLQIIPPPGRLCKSYPGGDFYEVPKMPGRDPGGKPLLLPVRGKSASKPPDQGQGQWSGKCLPASQPHMGGGENRGVQAGGRWKKAAGHPV